MSNPVVFISYSHDSDEHRERVLALSERLRQDGIDTRLDRYPNGTPPEGWPRWMLNQLDAANFVLVVCTETYYRRFRGHEQPGKGKGADWEGALITQEIYDSRSNTTKFVPVFLNTVVDAHIPEPLRKDSYYALTSEEVYQSLYDFLLGQAGVEPGSLGELKSRPRRQGTALSFDAAPQAANIDISRIDKYAPIELIGREDETKLLNDVWNQAVNGVAKRPRVLTFVALGGEGKTSLVAKWAADLAHDGWPGCEAVFAWSFYSQGTHEAASSDLFLKEALVFFGDDEMANSARHASEKAKRLAKLVGEKRTLLILDGVEPLQYPPMPPMDGKLKDDGLAALLKGLASNGHGLCVVTTRYSIPDLKAYWQGNVREVKLLRLSTVAGVALLKSLGVNGTQQEFELLVEDVRGHALTLNLLGSYLRDAYVGDIRKRDLIKLEDADDEQGGHAFRVMDAYVRWFESEGDKGKRALSLLQLLGLFDRPMSAHCFSELLRAPVIPSLTELLVGKNDAQRNLALARLEAAKLLTVNRESTGTLISLDTHPLLREYFAKQIREQHPGSWRNAHRRIYKHLITTEEGDEPTLEDLQPLYQAMVHGCLAGMQQEVYEKTYRTRIHRQQELYSVNKLGAFGSELSAVANFFEQPWSCVSPVFAEFVQGVLLNTAASCLRALGRLAEALFPMRASVEINAGRSDGYFASLAACNLSELELMLGDIAGAQHTAEQAVVYANRSSDVFMQIGISSTLADILHHAGLKEEARALFLKLEEVQVSHQPDYPLLYSLSGFRYCDLLLAVSECASWQFILDAGCEVPVVELLNAGKNVGNESYHSKILSAVSERAEQTLGWAENNNLDILSAALDQLTQSRIAIYATMLEGASLATCYVPLQGAIADLRRAGYMDDLPRALLTRAWQHTLESNPEGAQADLDEALEIAERGPMPLYIADIYLHRARLFFRVAEYPWRNEDSSPRSAKQDLAEARRLIEKHGYWRRKEELEDAEAVIGR